MLPYRKWALYLVFGTFYTHKNRYMRIVIIILFLFSNYLFSQEFLSIKTNGETHFIGQSEYVPIHSIRIDSVAENGDITDYYSYYMIRPLVNYPWSYTLKGYSWIGEKVSVLTNGINLFYNKENDTIYINTIAQLGENWLMYIYPNGKYIEATIFSIAPMTFLGINDTVKTIKLQVKDSTGNNVVDNLNDYYLLLSKNYGFIRIFNFYEFPFINAQDNIYEIDHEMDIIGMSDPMIGWQNITAYDIYNFETGDEYHIYYVSTPGLNPDNPSPYINEKMIKKVIDKQISLNEDTIFYTYDICKRRYYHAFNEEPEITCNRDTIIETIILSLEYLNKLSLEPCFRYGYYTFNKKHTNSIQESPHIFFGEINNDTLGYIIYDGGTSFTYLRGLGSYFYSWSFYGDEAYNTLVYYKKANEEWGTPYNCDSLLNNKNKIISSNNLIFIYPNPAHNLINIEIPTYNLQKLYIEIIDIAGKKLLKKEINKLIEKIDISDYPKSIFFIKIIDSNNNILKIDKIVKY